MDIKEIEELIPKALIKKLQESDLNLVRVDDGYMLLPSSSLLLITENGVSGFLARQILDIKEMIKDAQDVNREK